MVVWVGEQAGALFVLGQISAGRSFGYRGLNG